MMIAIGNLSRRFQIGSPVVQPCGHYRENQEIHDRARATTAVTSPLWRGGTTAFGVGQRSSVFPIVERVQAWCRSSGLIPHRQGPSWCSVPSGTCANSRSGIGPTRMLISGCTSASSSRRRRAPESMTRHPLCVVLGLISNGTCPFPVRSYTNVRACRSRGWRDRPIDRCGLTNRSLAYQSGVIRAAAEMRALSRSATCRPRPDASLIRQAPRLRGLSSRGACTTRATLDQQPVQCSIQRRRREQASDNASTWGVERLVVVAELFVRARSRVAPSCPG